MDRDVSPERCSRTNFIVYCLVRCCKDADPTAKRREIDNTDPNHIQEDLVITAAAFFSKQQAAWSPLLFRRGNISGHLFGEAKVFPFLEHSHSLFLKCLFS